MNTNTILSRLAAEVVSRIIALTFVELRGDVPTPSYKAIVEHTQSVITGVDVNTSSTFGTIVAALSTEGDGSTESVDKALMSNPHVRFQIKEIASNLAPIVVQSIRALDLFQAEAEEVLSHLHEEITSKLTQDKTLAPFEIRTVELGVVEDADVLGTVETISESILDKPEVNYNSVEYRMFARKLPFNVLSAEQRSELSKLLVDADMHGAILSSVLTSDDQTEMMFPDNIMSAEKQADYLSSLWHDICEFRQFIVASPDDVSISPEIRQNVDTAYERIALAIRWNAELIKRVHKNTLISSYDNSTIYVFPEVYNREKTQWDDEESDIDSTITNYIRAREISQTPHSSHGYGHIEVIKSKKVVGNQLNEYRRKTLLDQEAHTKAVIREVVRENLKDFDAVWLSKIIADLETNSEATLSDILSALITRAQDYYLSALYSSTESEEYSSVNPNEARSNVVLSFLVKVARDKIVAPIGRV